MGVLTNFSEFYIKIDEKQKSIRVSSEMEKLDDEYRTAYKTAKDHLQSRQYKRSSVFSDILSIDMIDKNEHFGNQQEKGDWKTQSLHQTEQGVGTVCLNLNNRVTLQKQKSCFGESKKGRSMETIPY